jgi:hypothetical protein
LRAYPPELLEHLELTVESLRTGQGQQPAALLEPLVEGLNEVSRALAGIGTTLEKHGMEVDYSVFESPLTDLVNAVEQCDSIEVADLLEYKIRPLFSGY